MGGVTSLPGGVVDGARKGGVVNVTGGVVRGLVGTVTKPAQGVLDFAAGTSGAVQQAVGGGSARVRDRQSAHRLRLPRVGRTLQNTLPPYSQHLAEAQNILVGISSRAPLTVHDQETANTEMCVSHCLFMGMNLQLSLNGCLLHEEWRHGSYADLRGTVLCYTEEFECS